MARKGDVLTLFVLSIITGVHCCVHLKWHNYWTTLKETLVAHMEYMPRCNIHLSYLGQGTYVELTLRTALVSYKIFSVDHPVELEEKTPVVIGTLTCEEDVTLDVLLKETLQPRVETEQSTEPNTQLHPPSVIMDLAPLIDTQVQHGNKYDPKEGTTT